MSEEIEVEVKREEPLIDVAECAFCDSPAIRSVTIANVEQRRGGTEYEICGAPECVDHACDDYIEKHWDTVNNRQEIAAEERYDLREGK